MSAILSMIRRGLPDGRIGFVGGSVVSDELLMMFENEAGVLPIDCRDAETGDILYAAKMGIDHVNRPTVVLFEPSLHTIQELERNVTAPNRYVVLCTNRATYKHLYLKQWTLIDTNDDGSQIVSVSEAVY